MFILSLEYPFPIGSMNPKMQRLSLSILVPCKHYTSAISRKEWGKMSQELRGYRKQLAQRRASLLQDSAEAQALKGQEALLAEIVEEEMAHQTQVSVLSHFHLQQAEEIKAQSKEIKRLSTLLETANYPGTGLGTTTE